MTYLHDYIIVQILQLLGTIPIATRPNKQQNFAFICVLLNILTNLQSNDCTTFNFVQVWSNWSFLETRT